MATSLVCEGDNALIVILLTCTHMYCLATARRGSVTNMGGDRKHVMMSHILSISCTLQRPLRLWNMVCLRVS